MRERAAVAVGLVVVAVALIAVLSRHQLRLASTNANASASARAIPLPPGRPSCQRGQFVPRGAEAVQLYVGTGGHEAGPASVSLRLPDGRTLAGRTRGAFTSGMVELSIAGPRRDTRNAVVCLRNEGARRFQAAGNAGLAGPPLDTERHRSDVIRVDYLRGGGESWWDRAPAIARRFALFKASFFGSWTLWAVAGVLACAWAAAIALVLRRPSS
jgi:hypothetical protein